MKNSFQYLVSLLLLLFLTTTTVVHGQGIHQYKSVSGDNKCMGYDADGYVNLYDCSEGIPYEFESTPTEYNDSGKLFHTYTGSLKGYCLSRAKVQLPGDKHAYDEYPKFEECNSTKHEQQWILEEDGRLTSLPEDDGYGYGDQGRKCMKTMNGTSKLRIDHDDRDLQSEVDKCLKWYNPTSGVSGDPIIMGVKGQQFKFDGRDGGWYANLAAKEYQWNMQFRKFDTCPEGDDMFISSFAYRFGGAEGNKGSKVLIATTPQAIPQCEKDGIVCLGDGTLHISFDGGETFVSNPADYNFALGSRLVAHNTYAACSRKWFDYDLSKAAAAKEEDKYLRGGDKDRRQLKTQSKKKSLEYLTEKKHSMINPAECEHWIQKRFKQNDLFLQSGEWSTIHIETPTVSLHIEYRRDNSHKEVEGQCNFQSLDSWMTNISPSLHNDVWNGILGESRTGSKTDNGRFKILRGKKDSDYEVGGPFGRYFPALYLSTTVNNSSSSIMV